LPPTAGFTVGATRLLRDDGEIGFIGTGLGTVWALEAADLLSAAGRSAAILHVPTLKPLDAGAVADFAGRFRSVITVENHSIIGGLGSAVCEVVAESGAGCQVTRRGVPDTWAQAGPLDFLRAQLGLDPSALAELATGIVEAR
jgi:transketolase